MITLMTITILLIIVHFVYDKIILPSVHLNLKNELFALRDEIRGLMIKEGYDETDEAFIFVHDGINASISRLVDVNLIYLIRFSMDLGEDKDLKREINERINQIHQSDSQQLLSIFQRANSVVEKAFVANIGAWLFYLIPLAVLALILKKLHQLAMELLVVPQGYIGSVVCK